MFQALIANASRRVYNHVQHISADRTLSSLIRGANCKLSKSTQSIFSNKSTRTHYHTSLLSQKNSKKKKLRRQDDTSAEGDVVELGRYERNAQGEWVRNVVPRKASSAVLSPELAADIEHVLEQDIDGLEDTAPVKESRDQSRTAPAVKRVKEPKPKKKSKEQSKSVRGKDTRTKDDKAVLAQYADLIDKNDLKPEKPHEIRAPLESHEETERTVTQVVEWLKHEKMADLCAIDLRAKTDWARFMVIGTALSERHNRAAAEFVAHKLGQLRSKSYTVHTGGEDNWLIVFAGDIVVELFTEERRKFYDIERLWVLRRPIEEEMDIDPDDLVRFQFDEEDGMYDDEVRAKIAAERLARGEVVEEPVAVREADDVTPVIPYSSRDTADKKSKKKRK